MMNLRYNNNNFTAPLAFSLYWGSTVDCLKLEGMGKEGSVLWSEECIRKGLTISTNFS